MLAGHLNSSYVHYVCEIGLKLLPKPIYPGGSQARPMNIIDYHSCIVQPTENGTWDLISFLLSTQVLSSLLSTQVTHFLSRVFMHDHMLALFCDPCYPSRWSGLGDWVLWGGHGYTGGRHTGDKEPASSCLSKGWRNLKDWGGKGIRIRLN